MNKKILNIIGILGILFLFLLSIFLISNLYFTYNTYKKTSLIYQENLLKKGYDKAMNDFYLLGKKNEKNCKIITINKDLNLINTSCIKKKENKKENNK